MGRKNCKEPVSGHDKTLKKKPIQKKCKKGVKKASDGQKEKQGKHIGPFCPHSPYILSQKQKGRKWTIGLSKLFKQMPDLVKLENSPAIGKRLLTHDEFFLCAAHRIEHLYKELEETEAQLEETKTAIYKATKELKLRKKKN